MTEEKYNADIKCQNCKKQAWNIKISKGMSIQEFGEKENPICVYCGCNLIKIKEEKEEK